MGVTPHNILHQSVRRNNELARVFHDLNLMGREGSGFDLLYEVLTSQGQPLPKVTEGSDRVEVAIPRRVIKPEVIDFLAKADGTFPLSQRERIALGILVQHEALTIRQLAEMLERHPGAAFGEIHERIGREIPDNQIRGQLKALVAEGRARFEGEKRWRRYWPA